MTRQPWQPAPALLGLLAGWVALFAWSGMVATPRLYLVPTLLAGLVLVLAGTGLRVLGLPWYAVATSQLALGALFLNARFAGGESWLGVVPTWSSVKRLDFVVVNGAASLNTYAAPVSLNPTHTAAMLTACGLAVLLSIDVLAVGLHRPPLAALPLLVTLSIPVSILTESLALPIFVGVALLFLRLLASDRLDRFGSWSGPTRRPPGRMLAMTWQVSIAAVLVALVGAPLVPVSDLLARDQGAGSGGGNGSLSMSVVNPFIRLRRDLVEKRHLPMVYAETEARSTGYLRTTVLDSFTSNEWRPSDRNLPEANDADGVFPSPPGLAVGVGGVEDDWSLQLAANFSTTWLPLPYPVREVDVPGSWRFDARTLDVAYVGGDAPTTLRYDVRSFTPAITARMLQTSIKAPDKLRKPMTAVPKDLPQVIRDRAKEVTQGATTDFAKAVAIQDWFREKGGFRYSLDQRGGSGMDLLADFVTDDRIGYCEQFAAAMAAMGRALKIPSRVVVGFLQPTEQPDGRLLYTSDDRHAWPEMYFSGVGWVRFEPTPAARAGATPSYTRQDGSVPAPAAVPSTAASPQAVPRPETTQTDSSTSKDGASFPLWPVYALLVVLGLGVAPGILRRRQRHRRLAPDDPVHLAEGAWAELRATALDLGLTWPDERSPREQARTVSEQVDAEPDDVRSLEGLLLDVERGRYARPGGPGGVDTLAPEDRARTVETVTSWRRTMAGSVEARRGWRARLWPRVWPVSVLRGRR